MLSEFSKTDSRSVKYYRKRSGKTWNSKKKQEKTNGKISKRGDEGIKKGQTVQM